MKTESIIVRELYNNHLNGIVEKYSMNSNIVLFNSPLKIHTDQFIPGTTYQYKLSNSKAIGSFTRLNSSSVICEKRISGRLTTMFMKSAGKDTRYTYAEIDMISENVCLFCEDIHSKDVYSLLLAVSRKLWKEKGTDRFDIAENWNRIDMKRHVNGDCWDEDEYSIVEAVSRGLIAMLSELIKGKRLYKIRKNDIKKFRNTLRSYFNDSYPVTGKYIFSTLKPPVQDCLYEGSDTDSENSISQLCDGQDMKHGRSLFTDDEINSMIDEMKLSIMHCRKIYVNASEFMTANDRAVIKAFERGKLWSVGYYGPSGTGKTTKLLAIAGALGLPVFKIAGSRNMDESFLFGKYVLKNGETVFQYGPLSLAMKYGGMFIFDEINMVDSDILSSLNDILDGTGYKTLENGETINIHRNFRFAESMNIGYTGTNEMNLSHKSRIQLKIKLSESSITTMAGIVVKNTSIDLDTAKKMCSIMKKINHLIETEDDGDETSQRIDLRSIISWANMTAVLGGDAVEASVMTVISALTENDDTVSNTSLEDIMDSDTIAGTAMDLIMNEFSRAS